MQDCATAIHLHSHYGIDAWWRNFEPGSGNWLLNKVLKQTFNWRKKYFFLELYNRFHEKFVIKSLIFKIFFSACFALCLHLHIYIYRVRDRVTSSVLITFVLLSNIKIQINYDAGRRAAHNKVRNAVVSISMRWLSTNQPNLVSLSEGWNHDEMTNDIQ